MDGLQFEQVDHEEVKEKAGALIREYLEWLNDRLRREYGIEFDVEAMLHPIYPIRTSFILPTGDSTLPGTKIRLREWVA